MTYQTIFDATGEGYSSWEYVKAGLFLIVVIAIRLLWTRLIGPRQKTSPSMREGPHRTAMLWFGLVLASVGTITTFLVTYTQYRHVSSCVRAASCPVVEGPVTKFTPMDHGTASFFVGGHYFTFSSRPLHEGLPVRVTYLRNDILRFEIATP